MNRKILGTGVVVAAVTLAAVFIPGRGTKRPVAEPLPSFPSYLLQPEFVDEAFRAVGEVPHRDAQMVLVNHHLLAANLIARTLASIATDKPRTVVLVSPDHFAGGAAPITSVIARWPTPFGDILSAGDVITALASGGFVNLQVVPFAREHGITNITMFIKKALPNARLVPIIIREDASAERVEALARALGSVPDAMIIGSFDFTHEATDAIARANDARSLRLLERGNPDDASDVVVDSRPGISLLLNIARERNLGFHVMDMSNSARLLREPSRTDVTSYITGVWERKSRVLQ